MDHGYSLYSIASTLRLPHEAETQASQGKPEAKASNR